MLNRLRAVLQAVRMVAVASLLTGDIRHDGGDEFADFLDLVDTSGRDEASGEGLGGEQRGVRDTNPRVPAEQFALTEGIT